MRMSRRATFGSYKLTRQKTVQDGTCHTFQSLEKIERPPKYASAASCKCVSVNDAMLTGPKLQRVLLELLLRFRLKSLALIADIKDKFSQVVLAEKDH